jgi:hypothetical protein
MDRAALLAELSAIEAGDASAAAAAGGRRGWWVLPLLYLCIVTLWGWLSQRDIGATFRDFTLPALALVGGVIMLALLARALHAPLRESLRRHARALLADGLLADALAGLTPRPATTLMRWTNTRPDTSALQWFLRSYYTLGRRRKLQPYPLWMELTATAAFILFTVAVVLSEGHPLLHRYGFTLYFAVLLSIHRFMPPLRDGVRLALRDVLSNPQAASADLRARDTSLSTAKH